jgi:hypothetical protein
MLPGGIGHEASSEYDGECAAQDLHRLAGARAAQLVEQKPSPEQTHQAVDVP